MSEARRAIGPVFDHLAALTDDRGLFEHALHAVPRPEHGYCVDDAARALVVVCREPQPSPQLLRLGRQYLNFVLSAIDVDGACHNRMSVNGDWTDVASLGDWWGRAVWGLGVAAVHAPTDGMRARALRGFRTAARRRSPHTHAMAFAALGAGEILLDDHHEQTARALLHDSVQAIGLGQSDTWPWPEPRLRYGNGSLVEALLLAGHALPDPALFARAQRLLAFLLQMETRDGHLSVTPTSGRGPNETGPAFDQQPIEVAALADACARAYTLTSDPTWLIGVRSAWRWFTGDNDSGTVMFDPSTGGGYDGLECDGHNLNQGAESTLALLSTAQHARSLAGQR
ncbi:MAG: glycosyltransferase [Actinomycetota bacterium]